ncbi:MAG: anhydro-N-acetylmuramic acid kinase [Alteromonadaceae bacterium]|jgi:anhydro-N-acetylmuramic acid kinase
MSELFIGLMSGTSVDGIDAVLVDFTNGPPKLLHSYSHTIDPALTSAINQLCDARCQGNEINLMGNVDRKIGEYFASAVNILCLQAGINNKQVKAIGSHGQTIRHYPDGQHGFSLQIGDPNTIAVQTGIDVIADFRKKDIALGGQGAPLVPAFHQSVFSDKSTNRLIVNLGGIANVTFLPQSANASIVGFDTGPGNTLLDRWCQTHQQQAYDDNGRWAQSGQLNHQLLAELLDEPFFQLSAPKSTGRELFNLDWLNQVLQTSSTPAFPSPIPPQDIQHTLAHLTAKSLAEQIAQLAGEGEVYLCGGGSHNGFLVRCIQAYLPQFSVTNTSKLGIEPDWVEAMAFAWLARAYTLKQAGNIPAVTGATRPAVLGSYFPAQ